LIFSSQKFDTSKKFDFYVHVEFGVRQKNETRDELVEGADVINHDLCIRVSRDVTDFQNLCIRVSRDATDFQNLKNNVGFYLLE